jgi:prevent-host-death family protein
MRRIGVRELRQNASRYLAQVARGETVEITQHGRPVVRLVPVPADPWADLVVEVVRAVLPGGASAVSRARHQLGLFTQLLLDGARLDRMMVTLVSMTEAQMMLGMRIQSRLLRNA